MRLPAACEGLRRKKKVPKPDFDGPGETGAGEVADAQLAPAVESALENYLAEFGRRWKPSARQPLFHLRLLHRGPDLLALLDAPDIKKSTPRKACKVSGLCFLECAFFYPREAFAQLATVIYGVKPYPRNPVVALDAQSVRSRPRSPARRGSRSARETTNQSLL
jgi:hypothetical protein